MKELREKSALRSFSLLLNREIKKSLLPFGEPKSRGIFLLILSLLAFASLEMIDLKKLRSECSCDEVNSKILI